MVGNHFINGGRIGLVGGGVIEVGKVEGFAAFHTGATETTVLFPALVAGPGLFKGYFQFRAEGGDVGLGPVDEGSVEGDFMPVGKADGLVEGIGKDFAAVGIDVVVAGMGGVGDVVKATGDGPPGSEGEQDHVAVGDDGGLHVVLGIVSLGDIDICRGETAPGEKAGHGGEVGNAVLDAELGREFTGIIKFPAMALSIIDGEGLDGVPLLKQVIEEHRGIHAAGVYQDGLHQLKEGQPRASRFKAYEAGERLCAVEEADQCLLEIGEEPVGKVGKAGLGFHGLKVDDTTLKGFVGDILEPTGTEPETNG